MRALIHGFGVNDADYKVVKTENGKQIWLCPFYDRWRTMIKRCYSPKWHKQYPSYIGCCVCPEWRYFSKFRLWMSTQKWEGMYLDKDLLVQGNRVYSPDTCCFISNALNTLFRVNTKPVNPNLPENVRIASNGKYTVSVCITPNNRKHCGTYSTIREAHIVAIQTKIEAIQHGASDPLLDVRLIPELNRRISVMEKTIKSI